MPQWDWVAIAGLVFTAVGTIVAVLAFWLDRRRKLDARQAIEAAERPSVGVCQYCRAEVTADPGQAWTQCPSCGASVSIGKYRVEVRGTDANEVAQVTQSIVDRFSKKKWRRP